MLFNQLRFNFMKILYHFISMILQAIVAIAAALHRRLRLVNHSTPLTPGTTDSY